MCDAPQLCCQKFQQPKKNGRQVLASQNSHQRRLGDSRLQIRGAAREIEFATEAENRAATPGSRWENGG